jgi:hypothetical protein
MNPFTSLITDMRQKRLLPVAGLLIVILIALPFLLSKSAAPAKVAVVPIPPSAAPVAGIPAISQQVTPISSRLHGRRRDPFTQKVKANTTVAKMAATTPVAGGSRSGSTGKTASGTGATGTTGTSGSSSTGTTGAAGTGTGTGTTSPTLPVTPPKPPAPAGLTPSQAYSVTFSITNTTGGFDTVNSLERLSVLPNDKQPLLVELGVLQGGKRVLFAVQPGASLTGPGKCIPGGVDCSIISLAPGDIEGLYGTTQNGTVYAEFSVTSIGAAKLGSEAAADKVRAKESAAGRSLLSASSNSVLSLFSYDPSLGAIVDKRNLAVGGN